MNDGVIRVLEGTGPGDPGLDVVRREDGRISIRGETTSLEPETAVLVAKSVEVLALEDGNEDERREYLEAMIETYADGGKA